MPSPINTYIWKRGDLIRNKKTGKLMKVMHVIPGIGSFVVEMKPETDPAIMFALQEKNYDDYCHDHDMFYSEETHTFIYRHVKI